jgi:hypothetical protein
MAKLKTSELSSGLLVFSRISGEQQAGDPDIVVRVCKHRTVIG